METPVEEIKFKNGKPLRKKDKEIKEPKIEVDFNNIILTANQEKILNALLEEDMAKLQKKKEHLILKLTRI
jgi:hypothetical protein